MRWELPGEIRVERAQKAGGGAECGGPLSSAGAGRAGVLQGEEHVGEAHGGGRNTEGNAHSGQ